MLALILLLISLGIFIFAVTYFRRKDNPEEIELNTEISDDCCGAHVVCERDSLLNNENKIIYFDDEELDVLANTSPTDYNSNQLNELSEVFNTLKEEDVAGWLRSLQLRNIQLPFELREEALLIVSERRSN
ncbi:MAG: phospholipase [Paludibacter sp.]|nr:phospholipase [Paludibacter sp.]